MGCLIVTGVRPANERGLFSFRAEISVLFRSSTQHYLLPRLALSLLVLAGVQYICMFYGLLVTLPLPSQQIHATSLTELSRSYYRAWLKGVPQVVRMLQAN